MPNIILYTGNLYSVISHFITEEWTQPLAERHNLKLLYFMQKRVPENIYSPRLTLLCPLSPTDRSSFGPGSPSATYWWCFLFLPLLFIPETWFLLLSQCWHVYVKDQKGQTHGQPMASLQSFPLSSPEHVTRVIRFSWKCFPPRGGYLSNAQV